MSKTVTRYGYQWPDVTDLEIEMGIIQRWPQVVTGHTLSFHYEQMRKILWPSMDAHRWHDLIRDEIRRPGAKVTVLMGPGSTSKTNGASWNYLCEYLCFPEDTCVLVSSTDIRGLRKRVWGEVAMLWQQAIEAYDWLPGNMLDAAIAIATDSLEDLDIGQRKTRDMRKGIFGVPCMNSQNTFVGLTKYHGIKQKRMRLIADEAAMMGGSFLQSFANLNQNEDFQAIVIGNPNDPMDPLGRAAEPKDGWTAHMQPEKTCVWDTRFMNGRCVNLIGTDSPNFDFPENQPTRYKYLISRQKIAEVVSAFGKDSFEYHSQCVGDMQIGQMSRRVITRDLCRQFGAQNDVVWLGTGLTKVAALDAAYGGDRCVLGHIEFGKEASGKVVINIYPPVIVPIVSKSDMVPEDQIAEFCKDYCERHGITPENFFHDSTGRGTLGTHLARIWSAQCNPIEFGGAPTKRPVSMDIYTRDAQTGQRRLKRCDEHYRKFVTELWYSVRYAIEAGQIRNLPEDVMDEGCMRMWDKTKDDKIELETKQEMKERVGRSPDLFDFIAIAVEGARRRGFQISKLANEESESRNLDWLFHVEQEERKRRKEFELAEV